MKSLLTIEIVRCGKRSARFTLSALAALLCLGLAACSTGPQANAKPQTFSSFDTQTGRAGKELAPGTIDFQNADLAQVLAIYQELSGRTVIRAASLPAPTITIRIQNPLNRIQVLQLLDTVLAENGIAMILAGDTAVKPVPEVIASKEAPPQINRPWQELPDSGSYMACTVHLKRLRAVELVPVLVPVAKVPNGIMPIQEPNLLILRDYSANIRRMLQLIEELEKKAEP
jgi:type II secretory pathway component GspD/PulD (secretin)